MRVIIDIDGTICTLTEGRYYTAEPYLSAILFVNDLKQKGSTIIYYTGRGWDKYDFTFKQLKDWGCEFDQLICGKPLGDVYIDDLSFSSIAMFMDLFNKDKKND